MQEYRTELNQEDETNNTLSRKLTNETNQQD